MSLQKYFNKNLNEKVVQYEKNKTITDIANLMENETFREFYDKYSEPQINWKSISMFMYVYKELEKRIPQKLTKDEKIYAIKQLMDDTECRKAIVNEYMLL